MPLKNMDLLLIKLNKFNFFRFSILYFRPVVIEI